jgi:uncharacterized delta-60 repeat protein
LGLAIVAALPASAWAQAAGDLDAGFGSGGAALTAVGDSGSAAGFDLLLQGDKPLAAGFAAFSSSNRFALIRLDPDGSPDAGFGAGGATSAAIGSESAANAVTVQADGKIVLAGFANVSGVYRFALARFDTAGNLDTSTFGPPNGTATATMGSGGDASAEAVLASGGNLLVGGHAIDGTGQAFALARFDDAGALTASGFGTGGRVLTFMGSGGEAAAHAIGVLPDGRIVLAGHASDAGAFKFALAAFSSDGVLVPSGFGDAGRVLTPVGGNGNAVINDLVVLADGRIVVVGSAQDGGIEKLALARYTAAGELDSSFGAGGIVLAAVGDGEEAGANAVAMQPDGKLVVTGQVSNGPASRLLVARFNSNGSPDAGFGAGGAVITPLGDENAAAGTGVAVQANGAIVAGGHAGDSGATKFALARYAGGGPGPLPPGPPLLDTVPPRFLSASLTNRRFRVGRRPTPRVAARRRAPVGTAFVFRLSEAARVTIRMERARPGVRVGRRCLAPRRGRRGRRCTRWVHAGTLTRRSARTGRNRVRFSGRIGRRALKLGRHRAILRAVDAAGNRSGRRTLSFKVVRR